MAAQATFIKGNAGHREIVDLRRVPSRTLDPLLDEEIGEWRHELDWDFSPTAALVRQYAGTGDLGGAALLVGGETVGYGYAVVDEPRGIIGDVYVQPSYRGPGGEAELLRSLFDALASTPRITRIESQLMLASAESAAIIRDTLQVRNQPIRLFERLLMFRSLAELIPPGARSLRTDIRFEPWQDRFMHAASGIIAAAYENETDSDINAQYRTPSGARLFLGNIVDFPGCGNFDPAASFVAFDSDSNEAVGLILSSIVRVDPDDGDTGHIAQLCVLPHARGSGVGNELLRIACAKLAEGGAARISLTVTASNQPAVSLYQQFGFHTIRRFFAYIWEAP